MQRETAEREDLLQELPAVPDYGQQDARERRARLGMGENRDCGSFGSKRRYDEMKRRLQYEDSVLSIVGSRRIRALCLRLVVCRISTVTTVTSTRRWGASKVRYRDVDAAS